MKYQQYNILKLELIASIATYTEALNKITHNMTFEGHTVNLPDDITENNKPLSVDLDASEPLYKQSAYIKQLHTELKSAENKLKEALMVTQWHITKIEGGCYD